MDFEINKFAFLYGDYEYFQWFRDKTKENLRNVIKWKRLRRGKPNIEIIWNEQQQDLNIDAISKLKFGVRKAFLFHLKWPLEYPIFDSNVLRAMVKLSGISGNRDTSREKDYDEYRKFFKKSYAKYEKEILNLNLPSPTSVNEEIIKRRVLDRALWEFGRIKV